MLRQFSPPELVTGDLSSLIEVYVVDFDPATNLCANPSAEKDVLLWSALSGGTLVQTLDFQVFGAYGFRYTPTTTTTDGIVYSAGFSTTAGLPYLLTLYFQGAAGKPYRLFFATTGNAEIGTPLRFIATGGLQRLVVQYTETTSTTRRIGIAKDGDANTTPFYIDGVLIAQLDHDSLYFDGSTLGHYSPSDYFWEGEPHASPSTRSGTAASSGRPINLSNFGFVLLGLAALSTAPNEIITTPSPVAGGSTFQTTVVREREFSLIGRIYAGSPEDVLRKRRALYRLLDKFSLSNKQELILMLKWKSDNPTDTTRTLFIPCLFQSDPRNLSTLNGVDVQLNFKSIRPSLAYGYDRAASLLSTASFTMNYIAEKKNGVWGNMAGGANGIVRDVLYTPTGVAYACGLFSSIGGVSVLNIARWENGAWSALGAGLGSGTNDVYQMALGPDGLLYAVGEFNAVYRWTGSAWAAYGGTPGWSSAESLIFDKTGNLYVGTTDGDVYRYNGVSWTSFQANADSLPIGSLGLTSDNRIWVARNEASNVYISRINTAFNGFDTTITLTDGDVYGLYGSPDGRLYFVGGFLTANGVACAKAAFWNGTSVQPLAQGFDLLLGDAYNVTDITQDIYGTFHTVGGSAAIYGNEVLPQGYALFNGNFWGAGDIRLPSTGTLIRSVATYKDRVLIGSRSTPGTAYWSGATTVITNSDVPINPRIILSGPSSGSTTIWEIVNRTTGKKIQFSGLSISAGETILFDFRVGQTSIYSSSRGELFPEVLAPGSSMNGFVLTPGSNSVQVFTTGSALSAALICWTEALASLDSLIS